jgi:hypothetical protein
MADLALSRFLFLVRLAFLGSLPMLARAELIPAHVFPDATSDVITHLEISKEDLANYPRVLDASLQTPWFWTTYEGEFIGYVSKRDISGNNRLKPKTLIRMDPTYSSWILTQYEPGDDIRVRSRLSVGRVSIRKTIPVYFRLPKNLPTRVPSTRTFTPPIQETEPIVPEPIEEDYTEPTISRLPEPVVSPPPEPVMPEPIQDELDGPERSQDESFAAEPAQESNMFEETEAILEQDPEPVLPAATPENMKVVPEETGLESSSEDIDPLLVEKPRMDRQELANMAPPPTNLFQEFEGFLKLVPSDDPNSEIFNYQLETRSGRRIVYVATRTLTASTYENLVDEWINIRGTLEETEPEFILFIEAHNIWTGTDS